MALNKGSILFEKLCELKYPEIHKFNPTSIDWLFDNEDSLHFLNWFCCAIQPSHLLSDSELEGFEKLKHDGITILEGKRLAEALANQPDIMMGDAEIETEIQQLQMQKENLKDEKQKLIKQLNWLNSRNKQISKKNLEWERINGKSNIKEEKLVERFTLQSLALNDSRTCLQQVVESFGLALSETNLLCQQSFEKFIKSEEHYASKLSEHANQQFEQNIGVVGQNTGLDMCAIFRIDDPYFNEVGGIGGELRLVQNWEINHYQKLLPLAEGDRIARETEVEALNAALISCRQIISKLTKGTFPCTNLSINEAKNDTENQSAFLVKEISTLKSSVLERIRKNTELRCSSVIIGDCSLKLLRQECLISKQKEFFSLMSRQWAREQLVSLALRLEENELKLMLDTVKSIAHQLQECNVDFMERLSVLETVIDTRRRLKERNTIPSHDKISYSLLSVLAPNSELMVNSCTDLTMSTTAFHNQVKSAAEVYNQLKKRIAIQRIDLENVLTSMENLVFGGPITSITETLTCCDSLEKKFARLDQVRETAQSQLKPLYRDFKTKQSALKNDQVDILERRLWTLFYTDVNSMQRKTDAIVAKGNAI